MTIKTLHIRVHRIYLKVRVKFIPLNTFIIKSKITEINELVYFKNQEKNKQNKVTQNTNTEGNNKEKKFKMTRQSIYRKTVRLICK